MTRLPRLFRPAIKKAHFASSSQRWCQQLMVEDSMLSVEFSQEPLPQDKKLESRDQTTFQDQRTILTLRMSREQSL